LAVRYSRTATRISSETVVSRFSLKCLRASRIGWDMNRLYRTREEVIPTPSTTGNSVGSYRTERTTESTRDRRALATSFRAATSAETSRGRASSAMPYKVYTEKRTSCQLRSSPPRARCVYTTCVCRDLGDVVSGIRETPITHPAPWPTPYPPPSVHPVVRTRRHLCRVRQITSALLCRKIGVALSLALGRSRRGFRGRWGSGASLSAYPARLGVT
jgi:hypothetical protein